MECGKNVCRPLSQLSQLKNFSHPSQLKKSTFHCFSAPTLNRQSIKRIAGMKGLASVAGVIGGQQVEAAGERLEKKKNPSLYSLTQL